MTTKPKAIPATSTDSPTPFLYDLPTTARLMTTTLFAVRTLIRTGKLRYVSIGNKFLVSPEAIRDFVVANERYYGDGRP